MLYIRESMKNLRTIRKKHEEIKGCDSSCGYYDEELANTLFKYLQPTQETQALIAKLNSRWEYTKDAISWDALGVYIKEKEHK